MDKSITDVDIATLSKEINTWETFRPYLGISKPEETAIKRNYKDDYELQKREMLQRWKQKNGSKATPRALLKACGEAEDITLKDAIGKLYAPQRQVQVPPAAGPDPPQAPVAMVRPRIQDPVPNPSSSTPSYIS